ncbi:uncharacterized protein PHACADRAFT_127742 [Phanerochaete carnosa HHB-10118-sp]|uniref:RING-type domain-containing protein n=1 Tax=Phanerochaete carnosa (strain HHB-10118-sp) TaxID=650164 RepID=K5VZ11_PHACS|nr:uncharacterized protein PHACADRAFT_127742 [Phanerochaete carnosa HHB-10118-sp]EKM51824.1 hypothetical protein PHACADRAFT_127742 [Phanerochaete carnosa HHB-10118-sp]
MSSFNYVDTPNDNLICCICRAPFLEPLKARTCCHTFCEECITRALSVSSQCPIDRCPLTVDDLSPADPLIRNLVDELAVNCPQRHLGCPHITQRQLVESHLKDSCHFVEVQCADGACDRKVTRKNAKHHAHSSAVEKNQEIGEDSKVETDECPFTAACCCYNSYGCTWSGSHEDLASHLRSCSYEAMKGFLDVFSSKMTSLSGENSILQRKIEALEGSVNVLRRENEEAKRALGPWYRLHGQDETLFASTTRYTAEMVPPPAERPAAQPQQSRSPGGTTGGNPENSTSPLSTARSPPSSHLYPYHDHMYPSTSPYALPSGPLPPASSSSISPPQVPAVAPLNISTSLHRSLLSLRESIVTLSNAVDSLARRQDVALATEVMRLNEEVRGLRVVIHGLRMQMHSIMMDRNAQVVATSSTSRTPVPDPTLQPAPAHVAGVTGSFVPTWLTGMMPPLTFAGPRYPPYPYQQTQNQSVSGPKL